MDSIRDIRIAHQKTARMPGARTFASDGRHKNANASNPAPKLLKMVFQSAIHYTQPRSLRTTRPRHRCQAASLCCRHKNHILIDSSGLCGFVRFYFISMAVLSLSWVVKSLVTLCRGGRNIQMRNRMIAPITNLWVYKTISNSFTFCVLHRWKTVQMLVGRMRMAVRSQRRVDASLSKAHRGQAIQMSSLWSLLLTFRSFGIAHETARLISRLRKWIQSPQVHRWNAPSTICTRIRSARREWNYRCHQPGSRILQKIKNVNLNTNTNTHTHIQKWN